MAMKQKRQDLPLHLAVKLITEKYERIGIYLFEDKQKEIMKTIQPSDKENMESILNAVAIRFNIKAEDIKRKDSKMSGVKGSRLMHIVAVRNLFIYICYQPGKLSQNTVGSFLSRDHSSIINSLRKFENVIWNNERGGKLKWFEKECMKNLEALNRYSKIIQGIKPKTPVNTSILEK